MRNDLTTTFLNLVRSDPAAAAFYAGCSSVQRQAIHRQVERLGDRAQLQGFVDHLPSAAL